jgi:hypothetical protein
MTPADRAKARALCEGMAESRLIGECLGSDTINDALDLLPAALDDLDRLTTAMRQIATITEAKPFTRSIAEQAIDDIAHAALDGTAPKGG